ncbi:MAG TPA: ABC transporter permease [Flavisolibacter sp.]|jgi:ABC-2 type transport system permease protein|nr:ABC transporter permease [Flavisolibacter sp.]
MNKTVLIIKREYLTRVRKKTFILSTILFPVLYFLVIFGSAYIAGKSTKNLRVALIDSSGLFNKAMVSQANAGDSTSYIEYVTTSPDSVMSHYRSMGYDGYLVVPNTDWQQGLNKVTLRTDKTHGITSVIQVQTKLNTMWNQIKSEKLGIDATKRSILANSTINIREENEKDKTANAAIASGIGYVCGFLIYFILLIYGSQVMMGVMEEKTNRIAEVIVSSVRPFQLMLGKIIGISLVALTQFFLWIAFMFIIFNITKASGSAANSSMMNGILGNVQNVFSSINVPLIIFCFAFYLLGGFFFYSSLYAAIGSAVNEDMREAQSLSLPVTMLVIFSIAMMTTAMADPTGKVAFWASIIPFSSPIVMMARIPFGVPGTVPWWQLGLSMALLIAGFLFTTWFAGKIYRTGILMYGKKPSWKEMIKWAFTKA